MLLKSHQYDYGKGFLQKRFKSTGQNILKYHNRSKDGKKVNNTTRNINRPKGKGIRKVQTKRTQSRRIAEIINHITRYTYTITI